jgi:hypothetical protein
VRGLTRPRELGDALGRLTSDEIDRAQRVRLLGEVAVGLGRELGVRSLLAGRRLTDLLVDDVAPHLPVRDLLTLRQHHHGLSGDELAGALVRNAARTTGAIGAAAGVLAAAEMAAPPALLAAPVQLAAETLAVVAVELKLVAELHVVYGRAPVGSRAQLVTSYLMSWSARRAVGASGSTPVLALLSVRARQELRRRLMGRFRRNLASLAPLLAGAVAGAELNRRETNALGEALLRDLKRRP